MQQGFTLTETVAVAAISMMTIAGATAVSVPMIAREQLKSATYEMQTAIQRTRIESVSRNRDVKFVLDSENKTYEVWDTKGTAATSDDERLHYNSLPGAVDFTTPENKTGVTGLEDNRTGTKYELVYTTQGIVKGKAGEITMNSGIEYQKINVTLAGGVDVVKWDKAEGAWEHGNLEPHYADGLVEDFDTQDYVDNHYEDYLGGTDTGDYPPPTFGDYPPPTTGDNPPPTTGDDPPPTFRK